MREKTLEELSEPIELNWSFLHGGYDCKKFPKYVDLWHPERFLSKSCVEVEDDCLVITTNQGIATYRIVKKMDSDKWWIAELVELVEPDE